LALSNRTGRSVALYFLDLDRFKVVNDLFGHQVGDRVLQEVAHRLATSCRKTDSVGRFGGDEFVVICSDVTGSTEACAIAQHLLDAFIEPIEVDGSDYGISASVGIAMTVPGSRRHSAETLLRNADTAMYRAKEGGRGRWELFDDEMRAEVRERFEIERELPIALETDALALLYQPLVDVSTGDIVGAEALLRWDRPEHGRVLPDKFLPVAEDCGLITKIGEWVLAQATADLARWQAEAKLPNSFRMWVNVTPQQLADPNFPAFVIDLLARQALPPDLVGFEILEQALLDVGVAEVVMRSLRELGVALSLDDFGAGYSNFSWLQELPISGIKIDRRFIATLDTGDRRGAAIVQGLVNLGHSLNVFVVGEGVETAEQARTLQAIGCESAQGYFYGHPVPVEEFWLGAGSTRPDSVHAAP
jgi:diguanylate cyclase (GGDEF)-like protein